MVESIRGMLTNIYTDYADFFYVRGVMDSRGQYTNPTYIYTNLSCLGLISEYLGHHNTYQFISKEHGVLADEYYQKPLRFLQRI